MTVGDEDGIDPFEFVICRICGIAFNPGIDKNDFASSKFKGISAVTEPRDFDHASTVTRRCSSYFYARFTFFALPSESRRRFSRMREYLRAACLSPASLRTMP